MFSIKNTIDYKLICSAELLIEEVDKSSNYKDVISAVERNIDKFSLEHGKIYKIILDTMIFIGGLGGFFIVFFFISIYHPECIIYLMLAFVCFGLVYLCFNKILPRKSALNSLSTLIYKRILEDKYKVKDNKWVTVDILRRYFGFRGNGYQSKLCYCLDNNIAGIENIKLKYSHRVMGSRADHDEYIYATLIKRVNFPIISLSIIDDILDRKQNKKIWSPSNSEFNRKFRIHYGNEVELKKYFTQERIERLNEIYNSLPHDFMIVAIKDYVCIIYKHVYNPDSGLKTIKPEYRIGVDKKTNDDFIKYIKGDIFYWYSTFLKIVVENFDI